MSDTKTKGFWIETNERGEKLFCFKVRSHGRYVVHRYTLKELEAKMSDAPAFTNR